MSLRIAICTGQIPFVRGGAEVLAEALAHQLELRGHVVDTVRLPFRWYPKSEVLKGYLAWRLVDLEESEGQRIDRVIALKFPGHVIRHSHKITWLVQQFRQAYDLFGTEHSHFDRSPEDDELREAIRRIDTKTIGESARTYAISKNVARRLKEHNGVSASVLYPPPALEGRYRCDRYAGYVLSLCRLNRLKRVDGLIRAMARTTSKARCVIAGDGEERESLEALATQLGVGDRVTFAGYVDDDTALSLYADASAVYYAPLDEDYGLATVEAMKSSKPVLTQSDSGGILEFVTEGETGFVVSPSGSEAMAQRIDEVCADAACAKRLGEAAHDLVAPITWDRTIDRLVQN